MSNIKKKFFDAIKQQDIPLTRKMLAEGINVNALSPNGTALYLSVKLHNFELLKLLVEKDADINIVQMDFDNSERHPHDGLLHSCFISTAIDFLCINYEAKNDGILKYLLENRSMVTRMMIEERIQYCRKLFDEQHTSEKMLFDYCASYFLRKNMYDSILLVGADDVATMVAATFNMTGHLPHGPLNDGSTHQAFFTLLIRSLFEQIVRFKLNRDSSIRSEQQYTHALQELRHSLETYNLLMDISSIPDERMEQFYPSVVNNIINKLKRMGKKEEYTLPLKWSGHAVCLSLIREAASIVIRIDNLNEGQADKHKTYRHTNKYLVIIPKIIGEIMLENLEDNKDYFTSLIKCMKVKLSREQGIKELYQNTKLRNLNTSRISMMTDQLEEKSKTLDCFVQQVESNCFIKSHEPGVAIRIDDRDTWQKITFFLRSYAPSLGEGDPVHKRNELEKALGDYWKKETTAARPKSEDTVA